MEETLFRQFYKALIGGYYLPAETVKRLFGKIHSSLSKKKERE